MQLNQNYSLGTTEKYHVVLDNTKNTYPASKSVYLEIYLTYPQPNTYNSFYLEFVVIVGVFIFVGLLVLGYVAWNRKKLSHQSKSKTPLQSPEPHIIINNRPFSSKSQSFFCGYCGNT